MNLDEAIKILDPETSRDALLRYEADDERLEACNEACRVAAQALREKQTSGWISVNDRLPEHPGHYLICTSINYWHGGCMDVNENRKYGENGTPIGYDGTTMSVLDCYYDITGNWNRVCNSHVTHWQPLPEPPKGEKS